MGPWGVSPKTQLGVGPGPLVGSGLGEVEEALQTRWAYEVMGFGCHGGVSLGMVKAGAMDLA